MRPIEDMADVIAAFPSIVSGGPERTALLGGVMAGELYCGLLVLMYGDLGAGKTHLTKAMGGALGAKGVKSPSFAIETLHRLPGRDFSLVHADLYRLEDVSSITAQLEEYLEDGHVVVVEWAERWKNPPTHDRWNIAIRCCEGDGRLVDLSAYGLRALEKLSRAYLEMMDI